jgi:hypothetical protein
MDSKPGKDISTVSTIVKSKEKCHVQSYKYSEKKKAVEKNTLGRATAATTKILCRA